MSSRASCSVSLEVVSTTNLKKAMIKLSEFFGILIEFVELVLAVELT